MSWRKDDFEPGFRCPQGYGLRCDLGTLPWRRLARLGDPKAEQPAPAAVQAKAAFFSIRGQLALFVTALVTEDDELFARWQKTRGWQLKGKLTDLVNFQSTVQEVAQELDKVAANAALSEDLAESARVMAQFARTSQGLFLP